MEQCGGQRRQTQLINPNRAGQGMPLQLLHQFLVPDHYTGLWPTQQFISGKKHQPHSIGYTLLRHRLVGQTVTLRGQQTAAAHIVQYRDAIFHA